MKRVLSLAAALVWCLTVVNAVEPIPYEKPADAKPGTDATGRSFFWKLGLETNVLNVYPQPGEKASTRNSPVAVDNEFKPRSVKTLDDWKKVRAQIRKAVLGYFGKMPSRDIPLDPKIEEVDRGDYVLRQVVIAFSDRFKGRMMMAIPKGIPKPAPAVLLYDASKGGINRTCGKNYSRALAIHMARDGLVVVALDHWDEVFGKSRELCTMGAAVHFTSRTIDYLLTQKDLVHPEQIGIYGHVYGAEVAQFATAMDDRIAAVVASNSWLGPTGHYSGAYWDPPFWADGRSMGAIIQCVERASPEMYQSRRRVNYRPLPFLTQEMMALMAPRPYLGINHGMGAGRSESTDTAARDCIHPVYKLYGRPKAMELIEHRWGTNEPVNAREHTMDFYLRAMCGINPGKVPEEKAKEILSLLRSKEQPKQVKGAWLAGYWRCKQATKDVSKLIASKDLLLRRVSAKALQRIGDMDELFKYIAHKDPVVRLYVIEAISIHGTEEVYEVLAEDEIDADRWVKEAKWQTLQVNPWE